MTRLAETIYEVFQEEFSCDPSFVMEKKAPLERIKHDFDAIAYMICSCGPDIKEEVYKRTGLTRKDLEDYLRIRHKLTGGL